MKTAYEQGVEWGSCPEALEERKKYETQAGWYKACDRGDWLLWQLERVTAPELIKDKINLVVEKIVTRAINRALEFYQAPEFVAWANKWLSGEDRSESAAESAAAWAAESAAERAAWAAESAAAWAGGAAWAAERAAERAAWAAAWAESAEEERVAAWAAAWAAELKQQSQEIHELIPEWPG